mmetsp:Transcript_125445/g.267833  ORF Transcript_125445/g.267833 Transcript_125445/m.267833 type:complete len:233 (-) Transcript_125445:87-785(-)
MTAVAKLYYFHGRGKSQQSRWVLAAAGIPFENVCLSTSKEIATLRGGAKLTYNQVPMLEIEGMRLSQSMAIVRHASRLGGLEGKTPSECARVDEILEGISDARGAMISFPFQQEPIPCVNAHLGSVQKYFPVFEELIRINGSAPFAVGVDLTVADILLAELVESTREMVESVSNAAKATQLVHDPFPNLRALHAHVLSLPRIKEFMSSPNWFPFPAGDVGRRYVRNVQTVLP